MCKLLWFGIAGTVALNKLETVTIDLILIINLIRFGPIGPKGLVKP